MRKGPQLPADWLSSGPFLVFTDGKRNNHPTENDRVPVQELQDTRAAASEASKSTDEISSISSSITIVGKLSGTGTVRISGRIEGELHASTILLDDGAHIEGEIVAQELIIGGRVRRR